MSNPLHQPRPDSDDTLWRGRFAVADGNARYVGGFARYNVHLTEEKIWLSREISIPLSAVVSQRMIHKGWLIPRHALQIVFTNPVTGGLETVCLCKVSPLGLYARRPLEALQQQIEDLRGLADAHAPGATAISAESAPLDQAGRPAACEVCGREPAFYTAYFFSVGAVIFSYTSGVSRHVHCRRHLLVNGLAAYTTTALLGWLGIVAVFGYPFYVYRLALNLRPAIGPAAYVLAVLPMAVLVGVVAWLLLR
jgi:hypothetical protein